MNRRAVLLLPSIVNIHMQMKLKYTEICHTSKYFLSCRIAPHQQILSKKLVSLYSVAFYLRGHVTIPPKNNKLDNFEIWCTTFQRTTWWPANVNICHQLFPFYVTYMTKTRFNQIDLEDFIENQQETRSISQSVPINTRIKIIWYIIIKNYTQAQNTIHFLR